MSQQLPNLAELSHAEKDDLILCLFDELKALQNKPLTNNTAAYQ